MYIQYGKRTESYFTDPSSRGVSEDRKRKLFQQFCSRISLGESPAEARRHLLVTRAFRNQDEVELVKNEFWEMYISQN